MNALRWNIVLSATDFPGFDDLTLVKYQNKVGLAVLAFWLENDGSLPLTLYEMHREFIKNQSYREQYLENNEETNFYFKFLISHIHCSYSQLLDKLVSLERPGDGYDEKQTNANITIRTTGIGA